MAAKPRKSVVQNIIRNLLEMEIPEIQTASKELAEWIKQLEQHSFKLQHYATEIENWATEEEEVDTVELTDLIKDLEATLSDMRKSPPAPAIAPPEQEDLETTSDRMLRAYGRTGRVLKDSRGIPKSELKPGEGRTVVRLGDLGKGVEPEAQKESVKAQPESAADKAVDKPRVKAEIPTGGKEIALRGTGKAPPEDEESKSGYMTPEGFVIRKLRP
jgi:hypothetical protein